MIEHCDSAEHEGWLALRQALWPNCSVDEHRTELEAACGQPERFCQFVAYDDSGSAVGFVEASLRTDYVNGARSSPVASPVPIMARPMPRITDLTSARSRLISPSFTIRSVMQPTPE